jgi:phosphopantothenoylcysteine synthetase/decarboxylase
LSFAAARLDADRTLQLARSMSSVNSRKGAIWKVVVEVGKTDFGRALEIERGIKYPNREYAARRVDAVRSRVADALATTAPVLVAPAMDAQMWAHAATQANVALLRERGVIFVGPAEGRLASGHMGLGRLVETDALLGALRQTLGVHGDLAGRRIVVSAGGTHEPLDPVRFIGNRSSGKMGFAIAEAARDRGAQVTLVCGPVALATPYGVPHMRSLMDGSSSSTQVVSVPT